jgi:hypothetical protein
MLLRYGMMAGALLFGKDLVIVAPASSRVYGEKCGSLDGMLD